VLLALALVLFGLGWGARQGWQKEYAQLQALYAQAGGLAQVRAQQAACAQNLKAVALRHLPQADERVAGLPQTAHSLAEYLLTLSSVQASLRDQGYIDSLIRQMDQLAASPAAQAYQAAAEDYAQRIQSTFSGRIAQGLGVPPVAQLPDHVEVQPAYPERGGAVNDYANVLSSQMAAQLEAFHESLKEKTGVGFYLANLHFLDGQDIKTYAETLFAQWGLGENDLLVLLAVGEDNYYSCAGRELTKKFPDASQQILLSQHLQKPFVTQQYDQAMADYIPALAASLGKTFGETVPLTGAMAPQATPGPTARVDWARLFAEDDWEDRLEDKVENSLERILRGEEKGSGISLGKTLTIAFVLWLIFGKKKRRRGLKGCGCSPIGWILAALGLQKFFDKD
ncbi:MAG: TPM domain-containing protein, partial [Clostridia bacterium]|nr:TPM domain-containing protein [Clostridia bacterium]